MARDSHNTRIGGVKQELQDLKKDVSSSLADFKASIDTKFDVFSNCLNANVPLYIKSPRISEVPMADTSDFIELKP